ncbi:MAG: hypothetical protein M3R38_01790 [Actinomycetota bacterium]|nr:hypothetical protein [Actinomycetota bacterium]
MSDRARQRRIERNAEQIAKIAEHWDHWFQRGTAGSNFNLEVVRKRGGKSPMSNLGHRVLSDPDTAHAFRHIYPILAELEGTEIGKVAAILRHHPTAIRRWRTEETPNDRYWLERFRVFCRVAAMRLERRYPGLSIRVNVRPEEEPVDETKAGSWKRGAVLQQKRWGWIDSARSVGKEIRAIMEEEGCSAEAAKGLLVDRKGYGPGEVDKKWRFYRKEEEGEDGAA